MFSSTHILLNYSMLSQSSLFVIFFFLLSGRITENRSKPGFTEPPKPLNTASGASQPQDPRRIRRA